MELELPAVGVRNLSHPPPGKSLFSFLRRVIPLADLLCLLLICLFAFGCAGSPLRCTGSSRRDLSYYRAQALQHRLNGCGCMGSAASLLAQMVENLPAVQKIRVQPLSQEDPLEEGMATYCSIVLP